MHVSIESEFNPIEPPLSPSLSFALESTELDESSIDAIVCESAIDGNSASFTSHAVVARYTNFHIARYEAAVVDVFESACI